MGRPSKTAKLSSEYLAIDKVNKLAKQLTKFSAETGLSVRTLADKSAGYAEYLQSKSKKG